MEKIHTIEKWARGEGESFIDSLYESYWDTSRAIANEVLNHLKDMMDSAEEDIEGFRKYNYCLTDAVNEFIEIFDDAFSDHYDRLAEMASLDLEICDDDPFIVEMYRITEEHVNEAMKQIRTILAA